jgi:YidC/Oxa1 family membrane protein insertase
VTADYQLASSLMMQAATMDQTQRLLLLLPLLFVIVIISFPAGLILYWITTNTSTIGQQWVLRRRIGPVVPLAPAAPAQSLGGRAGGRATTTANGDASGGSGGLSGLLGESPSPRRRSLPPLDRTHARAVRRRRRHPAGIRRFRTPALAIERPA